MCRASHPPQRARRNCCRKRTCSAGERSMTIREGTAGTRTTPKGGTSRCSKRPVRCATTHPITVRCSMWNDLAHDRRRILHFGVTTHPTAEWTAHQLREAFPWDTAPRYLLRDRDRVFGQEFMNQVKAMGIKQVLSAPRSPWQRAYVERVISTIRRECLDHVIVFNQTSLSRHLQSFL